MLVTTRNWLTCCTYLANQRSETADKVYNACYGFRTNCIIANINGFHFCNETMLFLGTYFSLVICRVIVGRLVWADAWALSHRCVLNCLFIHFKFIDWQKKLTRFFFYGFSLNFLDITLTSEHDILDFHGKSFEQFWPQFGAYAFHTRHSIPKRMLPIFPSTYHCLMDLRVIFIYPWWIHFDCVGIDRRTWYPLKMEHFKGKGPLWLHGWIFMSSFIINQNSNDTHTQALNHTKCQFDEKVITRCCQLAFSLHFISINDSFYTLGKRNWAQSMDCFKFIRQ